MFRIFRFSGVIRGVSIYFRSDLSNQIRGSKLGFGRVRDRVGRSEFLYKLGILVVRRASSPRNSQRLCRSVLGQIKNNKMPKYTKHATIVRPELLGVPRDITRRRGPPAWHTSANIEAAGMTTNVKVVELCCPCRRRVCQSPSPEMHPTHPEMAPKWSQHGPKMAPTCSQDGPKMTPKLTQIGPNMVPTWSRTWSRNCPKWPRLMFHNVSSFHPLAHTMRVNTEQRVVSVQDEPERSEVLAARGRFSICSDVRSSDGDHRAHYYEFSLERPRRPAGTKNGVGDSGAWALAPIWVNLEQWRWPCLDHCRLILGPFWEPISGPLGQFGTKTAPTVEHQLNTSVGDEAPTRWSSKRSGGNATTQRIPWGPFRGHVGAILGPSLDQLRGQSGSKR